MADKANSQTGPNHNLLPPLQCPRCNSSNTKFCYYNNYSLSQPRHFCKACKRYWTRGGTLRNVPVGGGCRKNKRMKRPSSGGVKISGGSAAAANPKMDLSPPPNHAINNNSHTRLFYNSLEPIDFPFSSFSSIRVSSETDDNNNTGFGFQPQMISGVGLGFSSGLMANVVEVPKQISSAAGDDDPIFFGSSAFASSSSTMASLLASSFQHQKFGTSGLFKDVDQAGNGVSGLMPYDQCSENGSVIGKGVKFEDENRFGWNPEPNPNPIIEQIDSSVPSSLTWNTTNLGAWFDQASNSNMGSSVPSLI